MSGDHGSQRRHGPSASYSSAHRTLFGSPTVAPPSPADSQGARKIVRLKKEDLFPEEDEGERARYVLEKEVGRGAMGTVLKIFDNDLRRDLAMKVILEQQEADLAADSSVTMSKVERFLAEAQIMGQLEHPGIVPVHELGVDDDGRVYFTMRLVRGMTFSDVIALARTGEDGWSLTRALGSLLKVCETLAYAHSRGVVHRDLKPANIMIGRFGETYVMDWGTARLADDEPEKKSGSVTWVETDRQRKIRMGANAATTQEGAVLGTPFYMPFEQASGLLSEVGPHSDVYAVGSMLYELMTGLRPYERSLTANQTVLEVISGILEGPPKSILDHGCNAPAELIAICEKAMAREWRERYPDMNAMGEDLRAFLEGRVVEAYDTSRGARVKKWISRNRALFGALVGVVLLVIGGTVSILLMQNEKLAAVNAEQLLTREAKDAAEENAERAWRESYVANMVAANASLRSNEVREAKRLLSLAPEALRGWEWRHLSLRTDSTSLTIEAHDGEVRSLAVDAEGATLLSSSDDGTVRTWDARTGALLTELDEDMGNVVSAAFSPNGSRIYTFEGWTVARMRIWDAGTRELQGVMNLPMAPTSTLAMSVDGKLLAFATVAHELWLVDAIGGHALFTLGVHDRTVRALAFDAQGSRIFSASEDGTARVWSTATGEELSRFESPDGAFFALALDPRRNELVTGAENGQVRLWDIDTGESEPFFLHEATVQALAFSPDGAYLASAGLDKSLEVRELESNRTIRLRGHDEPARHVEFVGPSRIVAGGEEGYLRAWDLDRDQGLAVFRGPEELVSSVAFAPDRGSLAVGSQYGGTVQLIDPLTGRVQRELAGAEDPVNAVAFDSAGRWIAVAHEEAASVIVYSVEDGTVVHELYGHDASATAVSFRSDGTLLATGSTDYTVALWDLAGGNVVRTLEYDSAVRAVAFEPGGTRLAIALEDGTTVVVASETGEPLARLVVEGGAGALAWSPDGLRLAIGGEDNSIRLWNLVSPPDELKGHEQRISCLSFHPDGSRLVSGSFDQSLRIWDLEEGRPLLTLRQHEAPITSAAFSLDGSTIASGSFDNTVRVWNTR